MNCFERIIIRLASNQTLDKMKNTILFFAIVFGSSLLAQDRSIEFQDITFDEALKASRTENKPIFMDCYAVWCGPCKWMSANIFTNNAVADYYNENYICVKFDMEKGEGIDIAKKYDFLKKFFPYF